MGRFLTGPRLVMTAGKPTFQLGMALWRKLAIRLANRGIRKIFRDLGVAAASDQEQGNRQQSHARDYALSLAWLPNTKTWAASHPCRTMYL